ncbi:MAG: hypothetical protein FGM41_03255 [Bacteroidetes bacterium]|nr:hypothetical protein [Bacteroidota bacterium]
MSINVYQSLWLAPSTLGTKGGFLNSNQRFNGGWLSIELYYLSLAYSFLKLKKHYKNVGLICDTQGKELLIDFLGLDYSSISTELNQIDNSFSKTWALGKIYAYRISQKPFIHYDGDVFIWEKTKAFTSANQLVFQNYEYNESYYLDALKEVNEHLYFIPKELKNISRNLVSINAGILGCNSKEFIQEYTEKALEFVTLNESRLSLIDQGRFNTVFEQLLCYKIAKKRKLLLTPNFQVSRRDNTKNLNKLTDFYNVPEKIKFIHPIAFKKRLAIIGAHIHNWFNYEFPADYKYFKNKIYS